MKGAIDTQSINDGSLEDMLIKHANEIGVPEFVIEEILEHMSMMSHAKLIDMSTWTVNQFSAWYVGE